MDFESWKGTVMRLLVDMSEVRFTVSREPVEKKDLDGKQKADRRTGELLFTVQVVAFDGSGAEVLNVTVAGAPPKVTVGQSVQLVELEAIPWAQEKRNGVAFRAKSVSAAVASKAA